MIVASSSSKPCVDAHVIDPPLSSPPKKGTITQSRKSESPFSPGEKISVSMGIPLKHVETLLGEFSKMFAELHKKGPCPDLTLECGRNSLQLGRHEDCLISGLSGWDMGARCHQPSHPRKVAKCQCDRYEKKHFMKKQHFHDVHTYCILVAMYSYDIHMVLWLMMVIPLMVKIVSHDY